MLQRPISVLSAALFLAVLGPCLIVARGGFDEISLSIGAITCIMGYGIWKVRPWAFYSYLVFAVGVIGGILQEAWQRQNAEDFLVATGIISFIAGTCVLVYRHVSSPYFNPNFKRRDKRHIVQNKVEFKINKQICQGDLRDISRTGCFAQIEQNLALGTNLELNLKFKEWDLDVSARVVRTSSYTKSYGLIFTGLSKEKYKQIDNFISHITSDPLKATA